MKAWLTRILPRNPIGVFAIAMIAGVLGHFSCPTEAPAPPPSSPQKYGAFSPLSSQGGAPVSSWDGAIDPANAAFGPGGMQKCDPCSGGQQTLNTNALQAAVTYANANNKKIVVQSGKYGLARQGGQSYAIDFSGTKNIWIDAQNVTFRQSGDATSTPFTMFWVRNASSVYFFGPTISQRDVTNGTTDTVGILVGDGGTHTTDHTVLQNVAFVEGVSGDFVRLDGGTGGTATVTDTSITDACRLEHAGRVAIDVKPGTRATAIRYSFFLGNTNRDVWFEGAGGDAPIGTAEIVGNTFDRTGSSTFESVTLDGFGGTNNVDQNLVKDNRFREGALTGSNVTRTLITANAFTLTTAISANPMLSLTGHTSDTTISMNYFTRGAGATGGKVISVASDVASSAVIVDANRVLQFSSSDPGLDMSGTTRAIVKRNNITYHNATADSGSTGFVGILCAGTASQACSGLYNENRVKRGDQSILASLALNSVAANDNTVVQARIFGTFGNTLQVRTVADASSAAGSETDNTAGQTTLHIKVGVGGTTVAQAEALINQSPYIKVKTTGTASTVLQAGDVFGFTNLAGGVQAGRMLAGIQLLKGSQTTLLETQLRDNVVDGAQAGIWSDADGAAQWPNGFPIFTSNILLNVASDIAGGITTWRTETSPRAEVVTTGALSLTRPTHFIAETGNQSYTLADGIDDAIHCVKVKTFAGGATTGTLTPTHFADGATHTLTWTSATRAGACLSWDAASTTWRLSSLDSGMTLN